MSTLCDLKSFRISLPNFHYYKKKREKKKSVSFKVPFFTEPMSLSLVLYCYCLCYFYIYVLFQSDFKLIEGRNQLLYFIFPIVLVTKPCNKETLNTFRLNCLRIFDIKLDLLGFLISCNTGRHLYRINIYLILFKIHLFSIIRNVIQYSENVS